MRIEGSVIKLDSKHMIMAKQEAKEHITFWTDQQHQDILELSDASAKKLALIAPQASLTCREECDVLEISDEDKLKIRLIESFIETLTGKKVKIRVPKIKIKNTEYTGTGSRDLHSVEETRAGWGLVYDYTEVRQEKEVMSFAAQGIVKTQDGREINLNLELYMTREFLTQNEIHLRAGDAKKIDPLVINFAGILPGLSDEKISFDLDADGVVEQISFVKENSGFLSLDINGDGMINDGSELFGPQSGNGFLELSAYDGDDNNWIDENDPIFNSLRIWTRDKKGNLCLFALGEVGIGAIYLGNISTLFSLNDQENQTLGEIKRTGLFLREDGSPGTVQHIDLAL